MENFKIFERWDLKEEDFKIYFGDTFCELEIEKFEISVCSNQKTSKKKNLKRCVEMMETILENYLL